MGDYSRRKLTPRGPENVSGSWSYSNGNCPTNELLFNATTTRNMMFSKGH